MSVPERPIESHAPPPFRAGVKECAVVIALATFAVGLGFVGVRAVREFRDGRQVRANLRTIGLALHDYHDTYGRFPPPGSPWTHGGCLFSWCRGLRPYLVGCENGRTFPPFDPMQPWDSALNLGQAGEMPKEFAPVGRGDVPPGYTCYHMFAGKGAAFDKPGGVRRKDLADPVNTILVVEGRDPVFWTRPDGLSYDPERPLPPLGGTDHGGFFALFADGEVRLIGHGTDEGTLRAYITGEPLRAVPPRAEEASPRFPGLSTCTIPVPPCTPLPKADSGGRRSPAP